MSPEPRKLGAPHFSAPALRKGALRKSVLAFEISPLTWRIMTKTPDLPEDHVSEIVQMALSDHVSFADIEREYGIGEKHVKSLMRDTLKTGSYKAWRKRVRVFGDRRAHYK
ncbi:MAG: hypothetical protein ACI9KS_000835 [Sulfitobacter sp.]|jgi:uncharacterized protein (TIGR03643 family)